MVHTQSEARRFFIDKVIQQAHVEGLTLSDDELHMLRWSESAPDSIADSARANRLAEETSDAGYEGKIAGLLRRNFEHAGATDTETRDMWQQAWSVLKQGDHYILTMIDQAVGRHMKSCWKFW